MSPFQNAVYETVKQIPKGKVATYKQIAHMAGNSRAARAVGMCMKHNPDMATIPCHRVVATDGKLTGYSAGDGITTKKQMLMNEGVSFNGNRVNLSLSQWQPKNK